MGSLFAIDSLISLSFVSGLAVVGTGLLALIPLLAAGSATGFFRFGWQSFSDLFQRLPGRAGPWGTVFDAETLRAMPFAIVELLGADRRILERRVTDRDGRFGFLVTPSSIQGSVVSVYLNAKAPGYTFPSTEIDDMAGFLYGNIYNGGELRVVPEEIINLGVPLDPVSDSKDVPRKKASSVRLGLAAAAMADAGLFVGIVTVPLAALLDPNPFSLGILFVFSGVASMRIFGVTERPYGVVRDTQGKAIPFALLTVRDDEGKRVTYAVSDDRGRYVLAVPRGNYVLTVRTPANVGPPRSIETPISPRKGWVTKEIVLHS